jgi:hypothetical protein
MHSNAFFFFIGKDMTVIFLLRESNRSLIVMYHRLGKPRKVIVMPHHLGDFQM